MNPEPDLRPLVEDLHRVRSRAARHHQAARARDATLDRPDDAGIDRPRHPEVVAVDDQHPRARWDAERLNLHGGHTRRLVWLRSGGCG